MRMRFNDGYKTVWFEAWVPVCIDKGALAPSGNKNVTKFYVQVVTAERPVDELFMHYFHYLSSASPPDPPEFGLWTPLGNFCSQTPNLPTPEKKLRAPMV